MRRTASDSVPTSKSTVPCSPLLPGGFAIEIGVALLKLAARGLSLLHRHPETMI
jgi:hypothetical protein